MEYVDRVWSAQDTTPAAIDDALRGLLGEIHREHTHYVPARVLNLICVIDAEFGGEIAHRMEQLRRFRPSRTIVCAIEEGRERLDAIARIGTPSDAEHVDVALLRESVTVACGPQHLPKLDRIADPIVVADLPTCVWAPHGHHEGVDALLGHCDVVLLDAGSEPDVAAALRRTHELCQRAYVVDLAWLRGTPWRERLAAMFNPPPLRRHLYRFASIEVRVDRSSIVTGLLYLGWLASRLGWTTHAMTVEDGHAEGIAVESDGDEVRMVIDVDERQEVPGFSGLTLETVSKRRLTLDRGHGGLRAHYTHPRGTDRTWTIMGASRGEPGILGEGLRQALLRDTTFAPAVEAAVGLLPQ